jgi:hypothetical protein
LNCPWTCDSSACDRPPGSGTVARRGRTTKVRLAADRRCRPLAFGRRTISGTPETPLAAATGASLKELMARMGHASIRAAMIYQQATAERDQKIADRMDAEIKSKRGGGTSEHGGEATAT